MNTMFFWIALLSFLLTVTLLVAVHEWGHYIIARLCGVRVLRFSIGFGKALIRWRNRHQTEFVIALIPLGGYVKMLDGREQSLTETEKPFAFDHQSLCKRICVIMAGPIVNIIFAVLMFWGMYVLGVQDIIPVLDRTIAQSPAEKAGIPSKQHIIAIDNKPTPSWTEVHWALIARLGEKTLIQVTTQPWPVSSATKTLPKTFLVDGKEWHVDPTHPQIFESFGFIPYLPLPPVEIQSINKGSLAEQIKLKVNDRILSVNQQPVKYVSEVVQAIQQFAGKTLTITIERDHKTKTISFSLPKEQPKLGIQLFPQMLPTEFIYAPHYTTLTAFSAGWAHSQRVISLTLVLLGKMINGSLSLHNLSGPIGIAIGAGQSVSLSLEHYLGFLGLLSISLGILNLLPIPMLDGGHLLYCAIEACRKKPLSIKTQWLGFKIGLSLLLVITFIAIYNDLLRLLQ